MKIQDSELRAGEVSLERERSCVKYRLQAWKSSSRCCLKPNLFGFE